MDKLDQLISNFKEAKDKGLPSLSVTRPVTVVWPYRDPYPKKNAAIIKTDFFIAIKIMTQKYQDRLF